jgi:tRNA (adenine37-N6)-methyltransferase
MMEINLKPIAWVKNSRTTPTDDDWGAIISEITLAEDIPDNAFQHILDFSQLEIICYFDKVKGDRILYSRKPRGNPDYPDWVFSPSEKKTVLIRSFKHGGINLA